MKIDNTGKPLGTTLSRAESRAAAKTASRGAGTTSSPTSDSVDVNAFSARLQSLTSTLANQPVVDDAKVAEIRQAISEGRFTIHPEAIADQLVKNVKDLLAKKS